MKRTIAAALLLAFVAIPFQVVNASLHSAPQLNDQRPIVLKLSDLRSAYLQRAGVVGYDKSKLSPERLRQQLQRHFDVVIGLLLVSTPRSIETALARLEAADDHMWSASERADERQQLLAMRYLQLRRLAAYRDRGQFPLNEGQADHAVPIFVDRHDTACAVGQLMRWSGWSENVAVIQRTNNLVYVPEAKRSPVGSWVLTSGLTLEEAALIQPGYTFITPYLTSDYEPGELSFLQGGLKYENFHIDVQNFSSTGPVTFHQGVDICDGCTFTPVGTAVPRTGVGFSAGTDLLHGVFIDTFDPIGNRWIVIGGATDFYGNGNRLLRGYSLGVPIQRIQLSFDVSTFGTNTYLTQIAEHSYPTYSGFGPVFSQNNQEQYEMTTRALAPGGLPLATTNFDETPLAPPGQPNFTTKSAASNLLTQANKITVSSTIWLYNGATVDSVVFGFQVVPEPSTAVCSLLGLGLIGLCVTRRRVIA
jgi:hypothetical protein